MNNGKLIQLDLLAMQLRITLSYFPLAVKASRLPENVSQQVVRNEQVDAFCPSRSILGFNSRWGQLSGDASRMFNRENLENESSSCMFYLVYFFFAEF